MDLVSLPLKTSTVLFMTVKIKKITQSLVRNANIKTGGFKIFVYLQTFHYSSRIASTKKFHQDKTSTCLELAMKITWIKKIRLRQ